MLEALTVIATIASIGETQFLVTGMYFASDAWSLDTAENNIRKFLGTLLWLITAWRVIVNYNAGRKGQAALEGLIGAFLALFVGYPSVIESLMKWFAGTLGFKI